MRRLKFNLLNRMLTPRSIDEGLHHVDDNHDGVIFLCVGHSFNIGNQRPIPFHLRRSDINNDIHPNHHHERAHIEQRESDFALSVLCLWEKLGINLSLRHIIL